MFYFLSKTLWFLAQPVSLAVCLLLVALLLNFRRRRLLPALCLSLAILILGVSAYSSVGYVALRTLEDQFTRPPEPESVTGIIVLGGGLDAEINAVRLGYEMNRSGDRYVELLRLARRYPEARLLLSGGAGYMYPEGDTEAEAGTRFLTTFGIDAARIIREDGSRTTEENVDLTRQLLQPQDGDTWLLITSAYHMPRAVGLFRQAGFPVVPWPADYFTGGNEGFELRLDQPAENLAISTRAMREWLGLFVYWATGRIGEILPGPAS